MHSAYGACATQPLRTYRVGHHRLVGSRHRRCRIHLLDLDLDLRQRLRAAGIHNDHQVAVLELHAVAQLLRQTELLLLFQRRQRTEASTGPVGGRGDGRVVRRVERVEAKEAQGVAVHLLDGDQQPPALEAHAAREQGAAHRQ